MERSHNKEMMKSSQIADKKMMKKSHIKHYMYSMKLYSIHTL